MLVYAVYADKKTFHVTLLASGKAEGAKVPDPSAPLGEHVADGVNRTAISSYHFLKLTF